MEDVKQQSEVKQSNTVDATTASETPSEEKQQDSSELGKDEVKQKEEFDYKAELERVKKDMEIYRDGVKSLKKKLSKAESKIEHLQSEEEDVQEDSSDVSRETVSSEIEKLLADKVEKIRMDAVSDTINDVLREMSSSSEEMELILHHYENTISKSGFSRTAIRNDIENAKLLANKNRLRQDNEELKKLLDVQESISPVGGGGSQKKAKTPSITLSGADKQLLDHFGIPYDKVKQ